MVAYGNVPVGAAVGKIAMGTAKTETILIDTTDSPLLFGVPVKYTSGKYRRIVSGDTGASVVGFLVNNSPVQAADSTSDSIVGNAIPNTAQAQVLLVEGYMTVVCKIGTPIKHGIVYVRLVAAAGKAIGDLEATADGVNNAAITGCMWAVDGLDASTGYSVISFNRGK